MEWAVIFDPENLALFGNGIVITLWLLFASLAVGAVLALVATNPRDIWVSHDFLDAQLAP